MIYENFSCPKYLSNRQVPTILKSVGMENDFVFPFIENFYGLDFKDDLGLHRTITNDYISRAFKVKQGKYLMVVRGDTLLQQGENCHFYSYGLEKIGSANVGNVSLIFKYSDNEYQYYTLSVAATSTDAQYYMKIVISATISDFKIYGIS